MSLSLHDTMAPPSSPPPRPRWPRPRLPRTGLGRAIAAAVAFLAVLLVVFIILFQWNWLRPPLARAISARIHRPVTITGNLEVHPWSWSPRATVNGLIIGDAPWGKAAPMATLPRLTVSVKLLPLLTGKVILPLVEADHPDVRLLRDTQGRANWVFNPGAAPAPLKLPTINDLVIQGGALSYTDLAKRLKFTGTVSSSQAVDGQGRGRFVLQGEGRLNDERFIAQVTGGPLIDVDPARPYNFTGRVDSGATRVTLAGRFDHPFDFSALSGRFSVAGPDLADLYRLTGVTLPNTPPYSLSAGFARRGAVYAFSGINGRIGGSDLAGTLSVNDSSGRPFLKADLASRRLRLEDLAAAFGGVPMHAAGQALSPSQVVEAARLKAEHRILPDAHLDVTRVRSMDAQVAYRAASVDAAAVAVRALALDISLDHGLLRVDPLDVTLDQGRLSGSLRIDARQAVPAEAIDLRLTNARLESLFPGAKGGPPVLEGGLYARARLSGVGDSVRAAAASANGETTVVVPSGKIRQTIAELLGIDATRGLYLLLTKSKSDTPIRCGVASFEARDGILTADRAVLDTGVVQVTGSGDIDLRDESLNLSFKGRPKQFRLVRISAPITVTGVLAEPKVGVDVAKAAPQVLASAAIGVFAAPLAAVLPFVGAGLAKNADCAALLAH